MGRDGGHARGEGATLMRFSRRIVGIGVLLFVLSALSFALLHVMPGSVEEQILAQNPSLTPEAIDRIRTLRGLDRSGVERYGCWLLGNHGDLCAWWPGGSGVLFGDLGWSSVHRERVAPLLWRRFSITFALMFPAMLLSLLVAVPLGAFAASDPRVDRVARALTFLGLSTPGHWTALFAVFLFAVTLGWFPASGVTSVDDTGFFDRVYHAVLPVAVLMVVFVSRWSRFVRDAVRDALAEPFVQTARAKGLDERQVLWGHAVKNALFPLITVVTQSLPALFSGAVIVEQVFAHPGVGLLLFESVHAQDLLVAMVVFLVYAAATMIAMALADTLYRWADPRLRSST
ncbi:MAG: ABC transporter permease [Deltaproteobacteria bacterium]|jgi:peptide/nickel transport system permease protein